jgi:predicted nucleic acid-binding protein
VQCQWAHLKTHLSRYEAEIALPSVVLHELHYGWLKMNAGITSLQLTNWFE